MNANDAPPRWGGWYKRFHAWVMANGTSTYETVVASRKKKLFASLSGYVLEIGAGTGPNLSYYPKDIHLIGIEPNHFMHRYLRHNANELGVTVELRQGTAEKIDLEDNSMDAVVGTLVLCSVRDLQTTLQEILRVLKPGGTFYFVEHVAAPHGTMLRRMQRLIKPLWKKIADGCHPDRETGDYLKQVGFGEVNYERFAVPVPVVGPHIAGTAVKKLQ